ncbi:hypothetical protein TNCV_3854571 [Trichonephila clavipes]|nr:hypothetical protein TNCV_3854571 [Trichonephila clavipes]
MGFSSHVQQKLFPDQKYDQFYLSHLIGRKHHQPPPPLQMWIGYKHALPYTQFHSQLLKTVRREIELRALTRNQDTRSLMEPSQRTSHKISH